MLRYSRVTVTVAEADIASSNKNEIETLAFRMLALASRGPWNRRFFPALVLAPSQYDTAARIQSQLQTFSCMLRLVRACVLRVAKSTRGGRCGHVCPTYSLRRLVAQVLLALSVLARSHCVRDSSCHHEYFFNFFSVNKVVE
jgi:hypothetical protein